MKDLGFTREPLKNAVEATEPLEKGPTYPSVCFRDDAVEVVDPDGKLRPGVMVEATVKMECTGLRGDKFGKSVDFDIKAISDLKLSGKSAKGEAGEEED